MITVTVRNNGPDGAGSVQVVNQMPPELALLSAYPFQGTYRSDTGAWLVGNLAVNAAATLELNVTPASNAESAILRAEISGVAETELNHGNNSRQVGIKVQKDSGSGHGGDGGCFLDNLLCS